MRSVQERIVRCATPERSRAQVLATRPGLCDVRGMALFTLIGRDSSRGVELRKIHREAHLAGLSALANAGRITYAGPLRDEAGAPCGSVVIFQAESLAEARRIADDDAYSKNGVFERVEVFETVQVFPKS